ncbi:hypothetical protein D3C77_276060 [compost metagenome]
MFAAWAEAKPLPDAEEALRAALGPLKEEARARSGGPSIAEWLAEMAEQGSMHAPGPQVHDVQIRLDTVEPPPSTKAASAAAGAPSTEALARLLPGVRGAAKGLGLVREGAMKRAEELARTLRSKLR